VPMKAKSPAECSQVLKWRKPPLFPRPEFVKPKLRVALPDCSLVVLSWTGLAHHSHHGGQQTDMPCFSIPQVSGLLHPCQDDKSSQPSVGTTKQPAQARIQVCMTQRALHSHGGSPSG
jgi:hypothetical protein